jgi:hypothetical protein
MSSIDDTFKLVLVYNKTTNWVNTVQFEIQAPLALTSASRSQKYGFTCLLTLYLARNIFGR